MFFHFIPHPYSTLCLLRSLNGYEFSLLKGLSHICIENVKIQSLQYIHSASIILYINQNNALKEGTLMSDLKKNSLDKEWKELILLAFKMGISLKEIREFFAQSSAGPK